jgi:hypothetical protein
MTMSQPGSAEKTIRKIDIAQVSLSPRERSLENPIMAKLHTPPPQKGAYVNAGTKKVFQHCRYPAKDLL